jgi:hypothetical protein
LEHAFLQLYQPRQNTCIENYRYITMQENTFPWVMKIIPAVVGALLALVLSGDIDKEGKI